MNPACKRSLSLLGASALLALAAGCSSPPKPGAPAAPAAQAASETEQRHEKLIEAGYAALHAKSYDEAIRLFTQAFELRPSAVGQAMIGDCYLAQWRRAKGNTQMLETANVHYLKALEIDPAHHGANQALGRGLVLLKRPAEALRYLNEADRTSAGSILAAQNLCYRVEAYIALGKTAEAEADFARLLKDHGDNFNTYIAGKNLSTHKGDQAMVAHYQDLLKRHREKLKAEK